MGNKKQKGQRKKVPKGATARDDGKTITFFTHNRYLLVLALAALLIHAIVLLDYLNSPFAQSPEWDAKVYWNWAKSIAAGDWMGKSVFHQPPLYPYFLAILISIFGENLTLVYAVQGIISASSAVLVCMIASKVVNASVGFIAGLLCAFYGLQVFYSFKILSESLSIFLMLLSLWLLVSNGGLRRICWAGIAFGLLVTGKPHLLLAVPLIAGSLALAKQDGWLDRAKRVAAFCAPLCIIVGAVTLRNYVIADDFVLISSNGGENLYIGNNPNAAGVFSLVEGLSGDIEYQNEEATTLAATNIGRSVKRSEVSNYWLHEAMSFVRNQPRAFVKLLAKKLSFVFSGTERSTMYYLYFERAFYKDTSDLLCKFLHFAPLLRRWGSALLPRMEEHHSAVCFSGC